MQDPYETLGVARSANQDEIKKAYRRLARKYHPDTNPGSGAEERFKRVNLAFDAVGDEEGRRNFDEFGDAALRPGFDAAKARKLRDQMRAARSARSGFHFRGSPGGGSTLDDIDFESIFAGFRDQGGAAGVRLRRRGADIRGEVDISLEESFRGATKTFNISRGEGSSTRLKVKVPPGADSGQIIRLKGQGTAGIGGGATGDVLLSVRVRPHPVLEREGDDLVMDVPVTVGESVSGAKIRIPTFAGAVSLRIPAGSSSGTRLRLKGKGMPVPGKKDERGNLYVALRIVLPGVSDEASELGKQLDALYEGDVRKSLRL